ncbi:MAG: septum formation protein Maf [Clostridia bacterium]|nr:septum formation protein Maf [Clostridia bacterium]
MKVILASSSPRRKALMDLGRFEYEVLVSDFEEMRNTTLSIEEQSKDLAYQKAKIIYDNTQGDRTIIAADTLVVQGDNVFGKPVDRDDAIRMLRELQGKKHYIYTSIAVLIENKGKEKEYKELHKTAVYVRPMNDLEIAEYIATEMPYDKAGSYGIQDSFSIFIDRIEGNYTSALGLPIQRIYEILKENGIVGTI